MATARPHHRASSSASSSSSRGKTPTLQPFATPAPPPPPPPRAASSQSGLGFASDAAAGSSTSASSTSVQTSILQPRVAVVLNVPPPWYPWLFALRLCSILPAVWWGLPSALQLLLHLLPGPERVLVVRSGRSLPASICDVGSHSHHHSCHQYEVQDPRSFALTEGFLATIWCFACGYLSFFFADCLMSRWLINYTPQATLVRLLSINAVNAYLTLSGLSLTGGFDDDRLLLPGWIGIATTLTVCYHITHQKINIRKETSTSINVFSIASYISMLTLLLRMHLRETDYPTPPLVARARLLWLDLSDFLTRLHGVVDAHGAEL